MAIKLPPRKAPSLKRTKTHVFPTDESPSSITWIETHQPEKRDNKVTESSVHVDRIRQSSSLRERKLNLCRTNFLLQSELRYLSQTVMLRDVLLRPCVNIVWQTRLGCTTVLSELPPTCDALPVLEKRREDAGSQLCRLTPVLFFWPNQYNYNHRMCNCATPPAACLLFAQ